MISSKTYYVYIMANKLNGTLYIGVTNDLLKRVSQHKEEVIEGFTKKYHLHKLVFFEQFTNTSEAIAREKQLKNWHRDWKINLIIAQNPGWNDLFDDLLDPETHFQTVHQSSVSSG